MPPIPAAPLILNAEVHPSDRALTVLERLVRSPRVVTESSPGQTLQKVLYARTSVIARSGQAVTHKPQARHASMLGVYATRMPCMRILNCCRMLRLR
jgi:hypothetical protein